MHFAFITGLFSSHAASALCWTLIHSLWQGLFFAIATGVIMMLTKKSHPALRYKILSLQFLLFIIVPIITFTWEWTRGVAGNNFQNLETINTVASVTSSTVTLTQ
ncbi:MAG: hypothetical protein ABUT20_06950, partial [Bacteroidota bacterium]